MKSVLEVEYEGGMRDVEWLVFPGGEVNVTYELGPVETIYAWIRDSEGLMALAQLKSILDSLPGHQKTKLMLGYVPYSRQDRVCNKGDSLAIKVFTSMINAMDFSMVTIVDPHSDVTTALLDNVNVIQKESILDRLDDGLSRFDYFVAPDSGATKEVLKLCGRYGCGFIQGTKVRDTKTGKLTGFGYYGDPLKGKRLLIVDDLCDGGGTFIGLASILKQDEAFELSLYVTHGMFTNGIKGLKEVFDTIYTTDTYLKDLSREENLELINVMQGEIK